MAVVTGTAVAAGAKTALSTSQIIAIGAGVTAAAGAALTAVSAANQADYNARQADIDAELALKQSSREETDFRRRQARLLASKRARAGATGMIPTEGSSLLIDQDIASETEIGARRIREGGSIDATQLRNERDLFRNQKEAAQISGVFESGASLLRPAAVAWG